MSSWRTGSEGGRGRVLRVRRSTLVSPLLLSTSSLATVSSCSHCLQIGLKARLEAASITLTRVSGRALPVLPHDETELERSSCAGNLALRLHGSHRTLSKRECRLLSKRALRW